MRLKCIKILGFKSFADKVVVDFHEGITGIVGPNGCGKSNISDAFRWVLGETSAKSLRGKKMEDVIFAGTSKRKPLNFAEVTITLTDIDGTLPVDYNEIEITRRYHRSGDSEFLINRKQVRMKDIQSLLLDSGIGKNAFSIFEQGKIDQVIQFSPLERRYIFEEAAGILRFLQRKREALRKLEQTDQNINRIKDIHKEVEKQIIVLEQQAEEAKLYKENKSRFETLEKTLLFTKWDSLSSKGQELISKIENKGESIKESNLQIEKYTLQLKEAKEHLATGDRELREKNEEVYQARSDKEIRTRERESSYERMKETEIKESKWRHELETIHLRSEERKKESKEAAKILEKLKEESFHKKEAFEKQKAKVESLDLTVFELRQTQQEKQQERLHYLKEESNLLSELNQTNLRLENSEERKKVLQDHRQTIKDALKESNPLLKKRENTVQELSQKIDEYQVQLESLEKEQEEINEAIQTSQNNFEKAQRTYTESEARQKALIRLKEENEGFSKGSKQLLKASEDKKSPLYKKVKELYSLVIPNKGSESAISSILKPYTQTLVTENEADFNAVIEYATSAELNDYSILCLDHLKPAKNLTSEGNSVCSLTEKVKKTSLTDHLLKDTFYAGDAFSALTFSKKHPGKAVCMNEQGFIDEKGIYFVTTQGEDNVFMREAEIQSLTEQMATLEQDKKRLDEEIYTLQEKRSAIHSMRMDADKSLRRSEMSLVEANFELQKVIGEQKRHKQEESTIESEWKTLNETINHFKESLSALKEKHKQAHENMELAKRNSEESIEKLQIMETTQLEEKKVLTTLEQKYNETEDQLKSVQHQLRVIEVQEEEGTEQLKRLKEELVSSQEQQQQFHEKTTSYEEILQEVEERLAIALEVCSELEKDVEKRKEAIEKIEGKIANENNKIHKLEEEGHKIGIKAAQADSVVKNLETELQERYSLTMDELRNQNIAIDSPIDQLEKEVRKLRKELEKAQTEVNMTSIDEYDKNKDRYEFLNKEIDDMGSTKGELLAIISKLDGESRTLFKETFEAVRANFQKNFTILFNGGQADLQFTEEGDVLEAGIEIIAKPPGKQMRSINLLSGGEKCLTAVALLFAIFEVKPAPFCILDEIDAPLDDTNVERFVNVVKQFIDRCQFIIITHNKRTMAICDRLFGVSMQERGISKLLTMEFDKKENKEEVEVAVASELATTN